MKPLMGTICIHRYKVQCVVGCYPHERDMEQEVFIDLALTYPVPPRDHIDEAVDYTSVVVYVEKCVSEGRFQLIESMAAAIGSGILTHFPRLAKALIRVYKPSAIAKAESTSYEIECVRDGYAM